MFFTLKKYFSPFVNRDEELNFLQIFKPLYVLLSALGLFPQAVEFSNGKQNTTVTLKHSRVNLACTLHMILIIHCFLVFHLLELNMDSKNYSMTDGEITLMNYIIDLVSQVLFCTVSYFHVIRYRCLYITILNQMADCWTRLVKVKERKLILGNLRVQVNCVVLGSALVTVLLLKAATYTGNSNVWKMILISLTFVLPEAIQFAVIAFYFVMVLMLVALLKNIEEQFRAILRERKRIRYVGEKRDLWVDISMAEIRDVYVKIVGLKRQINEMFQAPILVALLVSFHELVSMPHMIYHGFTFESSFSTHDVVECGCWLFSQLLKMYALAYSGALLKSQVNKIGRTIHNIPTTGDQDLKVYLEVQHFSSLINFQDIEITVYGYFPLDATLMFNIVASAAVYLVILVQFDTHE